MKSGTLQIPEPWVIEEVDRRRLPPDIRVPLQLPLPVFPDPQPKQDQKVVTIQL